MRRNNWTLILKLEVTLRSLTSLIRKLSGVKSSPSQSLTPAPKSKTYLTISTSASRLTPWDHFAASVMRMYSGFLQPCFDVKEFRSAARSLRTLRCTTRNVSDLNNILRKTVITNELLLHVKSSFSNKSDTVESDLSELFVTLVVPVGKCVGANIKTFANIYKFFNY